MPFCPPGHIARPTSTSKCSQTTEFCTKTPSECSSTKSQSSPISTSSSSNVEDRKSKLWRKTSFAPKLKSKKKVGSDSVISVGLSDPLHELAVKALLADSGRQVALSQDLGHLAFQKPKQQINKRFLQNTLLSTLSQNKRSHTIKSPMKN